MSNYYYYYYIVQTEKMLVGYSESVAHVGRGASHCPSDAR